MIGNEGHARAALARDLPVLSYAGSSRTVYLMDNVVYKVENNLEDKGTNAYEFERMTTIKPSTGVFFPAVSLYTIDGTDVIAMEYINGQSVSECYCIEGIEVCEADCMPDSVWQLVNGTLDDLGGFNTIVNDSGIYIIDMG